MASAVTWLDFSESEQQRVRDLLQFFSDKGTVDDLGLGTVRDAFSGLLFPGTSVVQTRARYFLFIPWIYGEAQRKWPSNLVAKAGDMERRLILALLEGGETGQGKGVIGGSVGVGVRTLPSAIYWGGLQAFGIFRMRGRTVRQYGQMVARGIAPPDFEGEIVERAPSLWAETPEPPPGFFDLKEANFALTYDEADWIAERMLTTEVAPAPPNLLGELIRSIRRGENLIDEAEFAWQLQLPTTTPSLITDLLHESQHFSALANGAALLYNLMLVEHFEAATDEAPSWTFDYRADLGNWARAADPIDLRTWCADLTPMWSCLAAAGAHVHDSARRFVDDFARIVADVGPVGIIDDATARELVRERELQHKKAQARFGNKKRLLAYPGYAGTAPMEFRWNLVKRLLTDIADGYENGATDAQS